MVRRRYLRSGPCSYELLMLSMLKRDAKLADKWILSSKIRKLVNARRQTLLALHALCLAFRVLPGNGYGRKVKPPTIFLCPLPHLVTSPHVQR